MYDEGPYTPRRPSERADYTGWVIGGLGIVLVACAVLLIVNKSDDAQTASNTTSRPAATQPASPPANPPSTTGLGMTSPAPASR